jgi:pimeloyl-ACP methyl ester carboxylesterase
LTDTTVVLLSPPCATAAAWSRVTPLLDERSVPNIAVQLPASLPASEHDDATFLRDFLDDRGDRVVLVGHSNGGWLVTEVGAHPAVKHLVYMDAVVPDLGESFADFVSGIARDFGRCVRVSTDVAEFEPEMFKAYLLGLGWSAGDARELIAGMRPQRHVASVLALTTTAWRTVPSTYIAPSESATSKELHDRFGARTTELIEIPGDHFPNWRRPDEIADILARIAHEVDDDSR